VLFYPKRLFEIAQAYTRWGIFYTRLWRMARRIEADPNKLSYMDQAMSPVIDEDVNNLEMMQVHGASANNIQRANIALKDRNAKPDLSVIAAE
jgi:hypothetical protein